MAIDQKLQRVASPVNSRLAHDVKYGASRGSETVSRRSHKPERVGSTPTPDFTH